MTKGFYFRQTEEARSICFKELWIKNAVFQEKHIDSDYKTWDGSARSYTLGFLKSSSSLPGATDGWLTLAYNFMVEWSKYAMANVNGEQEPRVQKVQKCLKEEIK